MSKAAASVPSAAGHLRCRVLSDTRSAMRIGELLRATRERHGLSQPGWPAGSASTGPTSAAWSAARCRRRSSGSAPLAAMGEELAVEVPCSRFDDHDPAAHRLVGSWDSDRRLDDFLASAAVLDAFARSKD